MARADFNLGLITNFEITNKMTVADLKSYIRGATTLLNMQGEGSSRPVQQSISYVKNKLGTNKRTGELKLGFKGKRKADLLRQARLLKGHAVISKDYGDRSEYAKEKVKKAYDKFKENTGAEVDFNDYVWFAEHMGDLRDIIEQLDSDQVVALYDTYKSEPAAKASLFDLLRETYNEMTAKGGGFDREEFYDNMFEKLEELVY